MYRFILFYFVLYICIYVAPWSCEARHLVPLYVHTCSGMTIKLNLTWLDLTRLRSWWWITGDRAENTHTSPSTRHLWSGWAALSSSAFTSPRISHGLLTQMQCWRRHISVSSSRDGWGSLERAPESSGPSTPALWRASWPAASPPGLETAPLATAGLCKVSCELPATLLEVSFPPPRISTPGGVQGKDYQRLQPPVPQSALSVALRATFP